MDVRSALAGTGRSPSTTRLLSSTNMASSSWSAALSVKFGVPFSERADLRSGLSTEAALLPGHLLTSTMRLPLASSSMDRLSMRSPSSETRAYNFLSNLLLGERSSEVLHEPGVFTVLLYSLRFELLLSFSMIVSFNGSSLEARKDICVLTWLNGEECL